jgi:5-methylcytosine-specific restriction protein A
MISIYENGDKYIWVPVAKEDADNITRAFLPFDGLKGEYIFSFKAQPKKGKYLTAITDIQDSFIKNISELFWVNDGKKQERQYKAKWRHGRHTNSPLLGPTKGWVKVPVLHITECKDIELSQALDKSDSKYAFLNSIANLIEPVLCKDDLQLSKESSQLRKTILNRIPIGQVKPTKAASIRGYYSRDASVVAYLQNLALGICECCDSLSTFKKDDGEPYLEVHHVKHLASNGSDTITNAIAVCANCHRELHFGENRMKLVEDLYLNIKRLIRE